MSQIAPEHFYTISYDSPQLLCIKFVEKSISTTKSNIRCHVSNVESTTLGKGSEAISLQTWILFTRGHGLLQRIALGRDTTLTCRPIQKRHDYLTVLVNIFEIYIKRRNLVWVKVFSKTDMEKSYGGY